MTFKELNLSEPILKALQIEAYTNPTPIQKKAIPFILQGRDLIGCAQTGTGKTAAFAIPVIQLVDTKKKTRDLRKIQSLVLTPTRELAIQISESFKAYGRFCNVSHTVIYGGVNQKAQTDTLKKGVDVLIATPGRLLDLMNQGYINLSGVESFVLDEADRMLDMGFIHDIKRILKQLPEKKQTLLFSATMPEEIASLSSSLLKNPVNVEVTPISSTAEKIEQSVYFVEKASKKDLLLDILQNTIIPSALVFTRTKHGADKVCKWLNRSGVRSEAIHGNKSQNARQRALANFKDKKTRILVATDIAARGIDVDNLSYVFNYDLPNLPETYVHRIGRTGRANKSGTAIAFCGSDERAYLRNIKKLIKEDIKEISDHGFKNPADGSTGKEREERPKNFMPAQKKKRFNQKKKNKKVFNRFT